MLYVVDGHNLIGKMPGLSLDMLDDEDRLLELLRPFVLAKHGRKIEIFFDKAPIGRAGVRSLGTIRAHYVQASMIADDAIARYVKGLGGAARSGVVVVSSDNQVRANARAAGAQVLLSEEFAGQVLEAARPGSASRSAARSALSEAGLSDTELARWMKEFNIDPAQADQPIEPPPSFKKARKGAGQPAARPAGPPKKPSKPRPHHGFPKKG